MTYAITCQVRKFGGFFPICHWEKTDYSIFRLLSLISKARAQTLKENITKQMDVVKNGIKPGKDFLVMYFTRPFLTAFFHDSFS